MADWKPMSPDGSVLRHESDMGVVYVAVDAEGDFSIEVIAPGYRGYWLTSPAPVRKLLAGRRTRAQEGDTDA